MKVKCDWCGKEVEKPPSWVKGRTNHFCSQKCHYESMRRKAKVRCDNCGELFEQRFKRFKRNKHNFCSRKCFYRYMKENPRGVASPTYDVPTGKSHPNWLGPVEVECDYCGKKFKKHRARYRSASHQFCSKGCRYKWLGEKLYRTVSIKCEFCGREIREIPSELKRNKRHFCNMECYGKWRSENIVEENHPCWRGGKIPYYGPNWLMQRRKTRVRDKYTCRICNEKEDGRELPVHHIIPFKKFGLEKYKEANKLSNLITLCRPCHVKAEREEISVDTLKEVVT